MALAARYLESVVEELGLCPYARPASSAGAVRMERVGTRHDAPRCAARVAALSQDAATEAVLLVFDLEAGDPRHEVRAFEAFLREFQNLYRAHGLAAFYSVMFHPGIEERAARTTPDSLVQVIRRAQVPMIQCLRASVMDAVRAQAQLGARRAACGRRAAGAMGAERSGAFRCHRAGEFRALRRRRRPARTRGTASRLARARGRHKCRLTSSFVPH